MNIHCFLMGVAALGLITGTMAANAATTQQRYYAHPAVQDKYGVIAPWYTGQNGQFDERIRVAVETLKRYPWVDPSRSEAMVPEYLLSSYWRITADGTITTPPLDNWMNGDRGQLASYVLFLMPDYYRYSGDPVAIAHAALEADVFLRFAQTSADHPWPSFPISVPTQGKPYGQCDPHGYIQLDLSARAGYGLLRTYQLTGNPAYFEAVKHWGDVFAEKRDRTPGADPWGRYANPEDVPWGTNENKMTGGVIWILYMFDELIRLGYTGANNSIVEARDAAREYLRDKLLPAWTVNDTWGRQYWDWPCQVQVGNITSYVARYLMDNKTYFPNWKNDVRNIMTLCVNRTCVNPDSNGDVYSGAWATPESCGCCGRCLSAGPLLLGTAWARYAAEANSEWARELTRRQMILVTYDFTETGVSEDNIDGGIITNGAWFESAHLAPLKIILGVMGWMPEVFGASRENHIMRSSAVVNSVVYGKGRIEYTTFDAPANTVDVLRLAFRPTSVTADGTALNIRTSLTSNGYMVKQLPNGDYIATIRHDGTTRIVVRGTDPQQVADNDLLSFTGPWAESQHEQDYGGGVRVAAQKDASMSFSFTGNQVRLIGRVDASGGQADIFIDNVKQLVHLDCWNPSALYQQVLYSKSGLANTEHSIRIVARGAGNPLATGSNIYVDAVQYSNATGDNGFGEGGGPVGAQRMVFGYTKRDDYTDSQGNKWWPGSEFVVRSGPGTDSVKLAWWTEAAPDTITGTADPELYRYGVHYPEIGVNVTVGPGTYHARLKFAATRGIDTAANCMDILINGQRVVSRMDVAATAGGPNKAVDLVFNGIAPRNGIIEIRLVGSESKVGECYVSGEAFVQAIEVGPGDGGQGATPVSAPGEQANPNLLTNAGFEKGVYGKVAKSGVFKDTPGWTFVFDSANEMTIWGESGYNIHPEVGLPEFHCGREALRVSAQGNSHAQVYQDVSVLPNTNYTAAVWVRAVDLAGQGFGLAETDSAGVILQEMDDCGLIVATHDKAGVTEAGPYTRVSASIKTGPKTIRLRFALDTVEACRSIDGHVTYDDCELLKTTPGQ